MPKSIVGGVLVGLAFVLVLPGAVTRRTKAEAMTPRELWSVIKASLMAPDGEEYFENGIKGAMVPGETGARQAMDAAMPRRMSSSDK